MMLVPGRTPVRVSVSSPFELAGMVTCSVMTSNVCVLVPCFCVYFVGGCGMAPATVKYFDRTGTCGLLGSITFLAHIQYSMLIRVCSCAGTPRRNALMVTVVVPGWGCSLG